MNIEQAVLDNLRTLPNEKQQEVLDFVEFLVQKSGKPRQGSSEASDQQKARETGNIRSHDAFLKGYAPEDEGLYDDYPTG
ncbi:hypothetical protein BZZ01_29370 [Nostocales cyanobacterium HT-58-2]|nr:hypothetical protein BZZ01_29370 [Nostocales cyanobacterium HT-58-2]